MDAGGRQRAGGLAGCGWPQAAGRSHKRRVETRDSLQRAMSGSKALLIVGEAGGDPPRKRGRVDEKGCACSNVGHVKELVLGVRPEYSLTCFADDLAVASGNATVVLRALVPVLLEMGPAEVPYMNVDRMKLSMNR